LAITRAKKEELVEKYVGLLNESDGIVISEYRGLTVKDLEELRGKIREAEGSFAIVKNTLARRAISDAGLPIPEDMLVGPVSISFGHRNLAGVAKVLTEFVKKNELMTIKGGLVGENIINEANIKDLADLPPIEVLRAQLLGVLKTPGTQLATVLNAPASQMVNVLAGSARQLVNVLNAYAKKEAA